MALIAVVAVQLLVIPFIVPTTQAWPIALRVFLVILIIFPAGFFMGQPFPLGVKWIGRRRETIIPWLWAINGVASVIGSVLATVLGLAYGFRFVSLVGILCYLLALALAIYLWEHKAQPAPVADLPI
jgi:predicted MFS family arabinose efflux permease